MITVIPSSLALRFCSTAEIPLSQVKMLSTPEEMMEFAAIPTVGDVMRLQDENRILVRVVDPISVFHPMGDYRIRPCSAHTKPFQQNIRGADAVRIIIPNNTDFRGWEPDVLAAGSGGSCGPEKGRLRVSLQKYMRCGCGL